MNKRTLIIGIIMFLYAILKYTYGSNNVNTNYSNSNNAVNPYEVARRQAVMAQIQNNVAHANAVSSHIQSEANDAHEWINDNNNYHDAIRDSNKALDSASSALNK